VVTRWELQRAGGGVIGVKQLAELYNVSSRIFALALEVLLVRDHYDRLCLEWRLSLGQTCPGRSQLSGFNARCNEVLIIGSICKKPGAMAALLLEVKKDPTGS
jgi:hypothetical protein